MAVPGGERIVLAGDVLARPLRAPARLLGRRPHRAQLRRRVLEVRLRPLPVGGIGIVPGADPHRPMVDEPRVERREEVARPAVVGRHDRHAEQRRLGQREAEALRAVHGQQAVQRRDERVLLRRGEVAVEHLHVRVGAAASSTALCASGSRSDRSVFTTSAAPSPGPNARVNASIAPSGFLRSATLP